MQAAVDRFDGIDVVLANAGILGMCAPIDLYPVEEFERVMDVNLKGAYVTLKLAAGHMKARGGGSIVLTSSIAGVTGHPATVGYHASKHALVGLMRVAAVEYADEQMQRVTERAAFTFADFVLCDKRYFGHFARVPRLLWGAAMLPVADWLQLGTKEAAGRVPYLLAVLSFTAICLIGVSATAASNEH